MIVALVATRFRKKRRESQTASLVCLQAGFSGFERAEDFA